MAFHVFFGFSQGINKSMRAPKGTYKAMRAHIEHVEKTLHLTRTQYLENPPHWDYRNRFKDVNDKVLCSTVTDHNGWVRAMYDNFGKWFKEPLKKDYERISPAQIKEIWQGFSMLEVPPERWSRDYYKDQMDHLYEVMRGRPDRGVTLNAEALTPKQAAQVMILFSTYLDSHDIRLDVPNGHDYLAASDDGGYEWCEECGAVTDFDCEGCNKKKCPLREEREG